MDYGQITDLTVKDRDCIIKFVEGDRFLFVDRKNGDISACLSFPFALERKNVFGFSKGIDRRTDLLYLEFQAKDGRIKVPVGAVRDVRQAEDFIRTVNDLYSRS